MLSGGLMELLRKGEKSMVRMDLLRAEERDGEDSY